MPDPEGTGEGTTPTTPEGGTVTPAPPSGSGGQTPAAGSVDLQAQLEEARRIQSGNDKRIAQLAEQLKLEQQNSTNLQTQLEEARKATASGAEELEQYKTRLPVVESELGTLKEQLGAQSAEAQRARLVATEYPALATLLEVGALPTFDGNADTYRESLTKIVKAMGATAQPVGIKPPASPPAGKVGDPDQLMKEIAAATNAGDFDKAHQLAEQRRIAMGFK